MDVPCSESDEQQVEDEELEDSGVPLRESLELVPASLVAGMVVLPTAETGAKP